MDRLKSTEDGGHWLSPPSLTFSLMTANGLRLCAGRPAFCPCPENDGILLRK
ncbi:hypothetical protein Mnod_4260 [Methylobacterium nodulans ORS 2060]|uniref:Uncharacterized protein n=1 Tax=Methylobacterium nodulans (strain LMG 21967 / CNCM I-2342 / ORS 2060) TaxID=460265 RepID=B8IA73_METNO|nr:hypothetical protein Mnod_4260 [Methylobacterium nodulans ORS 2060]